MRIANELNVAHIALQINSSIARENLNAMYYPFAMVRETVKSLISFIILLGTSLRPALYLSILTFYSKEKRRRDLRLERKGV